MPRTVGIGLVGVGWMGRLHGISYRRARHHYADCAGVARLVIAADESEGARTAVDELGFEESSPHWRDVIAHPDVEAVSITARTMSTGTWRSQLRPRASTCGSRSRSAAFLERPQRSPQQSCGRVRSIVGFNYRHAPAVQHARRLIESGALGVLDYFRSQWVAAYAANPRGALTWRFRRDEAGLGILGDLGSHAVDLAQFLLGPIAAVTARTETIVSERPLPTAAGTHFAVVESGELAAVENEDVVWSIVHFERGVTGTIEARVALGPQARYAFEAHGSSGAVAWDFERMNELAVFLPLENGDKGYARVVMGPQHAPFGRFQPGPGLPMGYTTT